RGSQASSRVRGIRNPYAVSTTTSGDRAVERLGDVDLRPEKALDGQRHRDRDEEPFQVPGLREREVVRVATRVVDAVELEHDDDTGFVSARVVLADDSRFPQPPHVRHLVGQERSYRLQGHAGLETVV